jgi:hypothetical protein
MNFDVTVWGLRVLGSLKDYDFEEARGYDIEEIRDVGFRDDEGMDAWLPSEAVVRLADWSEFAEAVLEAALEKLDV